MAEPAELTEEQCTAILATLIGGLIRMSNTRTVRRVLRGLAEADSIWAEMVEMKAEDTVGQLLERTR